MFLENLIPYLKSSSMVQYFSTCHEVLPESKTMISTSLHNLHHRVPLIVLISNRPIC